jgi:hypothetical protein
MLRKFGFSHSAVAFLSVLISLWAASAAMSITTEGLKLWLEADAGITLSGSNVSAWADQSGSGANAAQTVDANQPVLMANSINGLPAVDFDGVDDFMTFTLPINDLTGMTIFVVSAATQDVTPPFPYCQNAAIFWNESASWGTVHVTPLQSAVWIRFGTGSTQTLPVKFDYAAPMADVFTITTAMMDGANDYLYVNGDQVLENTKPQGVIANNRDTGNLGRGYNDDTYFPGKIAAVLVYDRTLPASQRQEVEEYLNVKYFQAPTAANPLGKLSAKWASIKNDKGQHNECKTR